MALRRPASSRARANHNTNSTMPPPTRARSAMSRSASSTEDSQQRESVTNGLSKHQKSNSIEGAETNIQVVIRCRRRSEREINDNSPIIVSSSGPKSKEITIETSAPVSSLGIVTLPPVRTYPFDLVFGPEADQAMIYHDVVSPMLDEVLMGYNCTLFAYGQTGTGKTYTMQGDLIPTPMGNPSADAGMIPRALFRMFHTLEQSKADYSVKISYIELYNEELRDLLANDLPPPAGNGQPMAMSKDTSKDNNALKIFDDSNKRGVTIQGLEEIVVKDSQDALTLLTKGSQRRQIAATKFNDHSSRSHSVFSITVHVKETSSMGDDLLKVGKLNLVDLAGSENIGRSGAENKRAREAGMINQSLLTLGRVINALVDRSQHIPYRESKLTRLLQDSLGGHTKTCIIATVSPARSNMEETLSTLDYALRAKSIRNKPELNQRMTRNSLLKEYVAEIERLKSDLMAAREKNGIFFSEETWKQMTVEQELMSTELTETKKQVEIVEAQLRGVRDEFEQSIGLLKLREGELKDTRTKLRDAETALQRKEHELDAVNSRLEEEIVVRKAHQDTENTLNSVAAGLKKVAKESLQDLDGVFEKLDRKTRNLHSNSHAVLTHAKTISSARNILSQKLAEFIKTSSQSTSKVQSDLSDFQGRQLKALSAQSSRVEEQIQTVQRCLHDIQISDEAEADLLDKVRSALHNTHESFKAGFGAWTESLDGVCSELTTELEASSLDAFSSVEETIKQMASLIDAVIQESINYTNSQRLLASETATLARRHNEGELERLRCQNEYLLRLLEDERVKADKVKDELVQRISGMLADFTCERDRHLQETVDEFRSQNSSAQEVIEAFSSKHHELVGRMEAESQTQNEAHQRRASENKRTRDGAVKSIKLAKQSQSSGIRQVRATVSNSVTTYSAQLRKQAEEMASSSNDAFEQHGRRKRARIEKTATMASDTLSEYKRLHRVISSASRDLEVFGQEASNTAVGLQSNTESYRAASSTQLESLKQASQMLAKEGTWEDMPTGGTPPRRTWKYVDRWELTKDRKSILKSWKDKTRPRAQEKLPVESLTQDEKSEQEEENADAKSESPVSIHNDQSDVSIPESTSPPYKGEIKKEIPPRGTLTDSGNTYSTRLRRTQR